MVIINGIKVSGYIRRRTKEDKPDPIWMDFVGNVLSMELAEKLAEPLDALDMPDNQRERIKESF